MRRAWAPLLVAALAATAPATADHPSGRAPDGVDSLRWMAGSWASERDGDRQEEHWTAPRGGMMVGMHRDVKNGRATSFEFFRIVRRDDGIFYMTQPGGQPATPFRLKEQGARRVVFENAEHDFPQRIVYWQERPGMLRARIEGTINGKPESETWTWKADRLTR